MTLSPLRVADRRSPFSFLLAVVWWGALLPAMGNFLTHQEADLTLGNQQSMRFGLNSNASGVAVDAASQKVFVADRFNNRVLRFGSAASLTNGAPPECAFGQPNLDSRGNGVGANRLNQPAGCWVDAAGRLWVADSGNHRVLRFENAATATFNAAASIVLGQPNFAVNSSATTQAKMNTPSAVVVDAVGRLWVADTNNARVLRFDAVAGKTSGALADGAIGQPDFTTSTPGTATNKLGSPNSLAVFGTDGVGDLITLWIGDSGSNSRVLRFNSVTTRPNLNASADGTLGVVSISQLDSMHFSQVGGIAVDSGGSLYVADQLQHRILRFDSAKTKANGAAANAVLGQPNFTTGTSGFALSALKNPLGLATSGTRLWAVDAGNQRVLRFDNANTKNGSVAADSLLGKKEAVDPTLVSAATLKAPRGVAIDATTGKVFVADRENHRVLRYANASTLTNGAAAEAVLGQAALDTNVSALTQTGMSFPAGVATDGAGRLWVADSNNARVLRFDNAATVASGASASAVLGQADFTSITPAISINRLTNPLAVVVDGAGRLYVSDSASNRILRWDAAATKPNGANASGVIGQANFNSNAPASGPDHLNTPTGLGVDAAGRLIVADYGNNRALRFDAPAAGNGIFADAVYGQPDFTETDQGTGANGLRWPIGVALDAADRLFVADTSNNRVLWFDKVSLKPAANAAADGVIGQANFVDIFGSNSPRGLASPMGLYVDATGALWCSDNSNNRVLRFSPQFQAVLDCGLAANGHFCLNFAATPGHSYQIRTSSDLLNWSTSATIHAQAAIIPWTDPSPIMGKKFYRVFEP